MASYRHMNDKALYQAYLVRFQRKDEALHWQVTLQSVQTGEEHHFANEGDLFRFLLKSLNSDQTLPDQSTLDAHVEQNIAS